MTNIEIIDKLTNSLRQLLDAKKALIATDPMFAIEKESIVLLLDNLINKHAKQIQLQYIQELSPEIEKALASSDENVKIGEVDVRRSEIEELYKQYIEFMNYEDVLLDSNVIPLRLAIADKRYLALQNVLNML